jgi:hypothetical protein
MQTGAGGGEGGDAPRLIGGVTVSNIQSGTHGTLTNITEPLFGGGSRVPVMIEGNVYRFAFPAYANFTWIDNSRVGNDRFRSILPDLFRDMLNLIPGDPAFNYQMPLQVNVMLFFFVMTLFHLHFHLCLMVPFAFRSVAYE